jgi:hypothetical protein
MDCNLEDAAFSLVYVGSTVGWKVVPYFGSKTNLASAGPIGSTIPSTGAFTSLTSSTLTATPNAGSTALTLTGGTVTASAPLIDATQTWNNGAVTFTGLRVNVTNTNSASASLLADFQVGGTSTFRVRRAGGIECGGTTLGIRITDFTIQGLGGGMNIQAASAVGFNLDSTAITTLGCSVFEQRNGSTAQTFRLYSTFSSSTSFERLNVIAQSAGSVIIGTEKGSAGGTARGLELRTDNVARINISATGGIGFFGATAAAQPAAVADATDAASVITQLNALLSRMRTLGLIAT